MDPSFARIQVRALCPRPSLHDRRLIIAFWRLVLGINLLYELALVFILFQDLNSARAMMKYLDPSLGRPLPEKSYAENCEFTPTNVWVRGNCQLFGFSMLRQRLTECHRYLLPRARARLVWQGPDPQGLLVLLGARRCAW